MEIAINKSNKPTIIIILLIPYSSLLLIANYISMDLILAIITFIFLLMARKYMNKNKGKTSKKYIVFSIVIQLISILLDIVFVILKIKDEPAVLGFIEYSFLAEVLKVSYIAFTLPIIKIINKANNPEKYKKSTDWFYEQ